VASDIKSVRIVGRGRVGAAFAARLAERGLLVEDGTADVTVLCVPDAVISSAAAAIPEGGWLVHVSGATPLSHLSPHVARFSVHPVQTFSRGRGAEQIDGAWAAITGETDDALDMARALAVTLGLRPFVLADERRAIYHAGASIASNFLVTLHRAAVRAFEAAGAPPEALMPLMRRTMDNGFDLTGPIARGDAATVQAHVDAIRRDLPDLEPMYRALAEATRR